jgi:hypothetical protein
MQQMALLNQMTLRPAIQSIDAGQGARIGAVGEHQQQTVAGLELRQPCSDQHQVVGADQWRSLQDGEHATGLAKSFHFTIGIEEQLP